MSRMITLICNNPKCMKEFERSFGEYNRKKNKGKPTYCSRSCALQVSKLGNNNGDFSRLKPYLFNKRDELTPFRYTGGVKPQPRRGKRSKGLPCGCKPTIQHHKNISNSLKDFYVYADI